MKILMVLTSHSKLGDTNKETGFWIEEFAAPYYVFTDSGAEVIVASPLGGQAPIDPSSTVSSAQTAYTDRYFTDAKALQIIANTVKLSTVNEKDFDAIFYPGGHGPMWDLINDTHSIALIQNFWNNNKPVVAVCHAPSVLLNVQEQNGDAFVKNKNVTGFTNAEEEAVQLTEVVPFLLQDELIRLGGLFTNKENWAPYVVKDGLLITGQNPASSEEAAKQLLAELDK